MTVPFLLPHRTNKGRILSRNSDGRNIYWTIERIKEGVENFKKENGRYPSASDFCLTRTLPTLRHINMYFGSINNLRSLLGIDSSNDPHRGINRSNIMKVVNERSLEVEQRVFSVLSLQFGEMFVHSEKKFIFDKTLDTYQKTVRVDFFVYNKKENFAVDVFYCQDALSFSAHARLKIKKYQHFSNRLYLVVINKTISNNDLSSAEGVAMKLSIPSNVSIVSESQFYKEIQQFEPYSL